MARRARGENPMSNRWMITVHEAHAGMAWEFEPDEHIAYAAWQKERAPSTGNLHWQIYVRYTNSKRFTTVTRLWPDGTHIEIAERNEEYCRNYCNKEDTRVEGPFQYKPENYDPQAGQQGRRTDLQDIYNQLKGGATLAVIAEQYPADVIRYHNGIKSMQLLVAPKPPLQRDITLICLWGPTGTGKTHRMLTTYPEIYSVKPGRDPFGSYNNETQILFDEFDPEMWKITDMNRYLDKWRCLLDRRYADSYAAWTLVAICANSPPTSWFANVAPMLLDAFRRRIRGHCWEVTSQAPTLEEILASPPTPL